MSNTISSNYQLPLDAATVHWQTRTENCQRDRIIQAVAVGALALVAAAALAATIALPFLFPLNALVLLAIPVAVGLAGGFIGFFVMRLVDKKDHYEKPEIAQEIVTNLRNDTNVARYCSGSQWWNPLSVDRLANYGFIKDDKDITDRFRELAQQYENASAVITRGGGIGYRVRCAARDRLFAADWIAFRDAHIIPHLPNL
jgi:hypothetical protein